MKIQIVLFLVLLLVNASLQANETNEGVSAQVRTAPIKTRDIGTAITGYGVVGLDPGRIVNLNQALPGRVTSLMVSNGQIVKKGQSLMKLDLDPAASSAYKKVVNEVAYARRELARQKNMLRQQLVTQNQVDIAERALKDAEAALAAQKKLGGQKTKITLTAPFNGLITKISVAQGDRFTTGAALVQLADTDSLHVLLGVEPEDSLQLKSGMSAEVISVFDHSQRVNGYVKIVTGQINAQSQLVNVIVTIPGHRLLPGSRVEVKFSTTHHKASVVPDSAVLRDAEGKAYIFQIVENRARRIAIDTGVETSGFIEIKGNFLPNSPVVILGNYELVDGMAVREQHP